jgi:hypothetical protein
MADACRNCVHWRDPRDGRGADRAGQCRALPPQAVVEIDERSGRAQWPLTAANDVCGGHVPSGQADSEADAASGDSAPAEAKTGLLSKVFTRGGKGKSGKGAS